MLPLTLSTNIFSFLARSLGPYLKVHKLGLKNLELAFPEKSHAELESILQGVWDNLGRLVGEFPHVESIAKNPKRVTLVGEEFLERARDSKTPVLFMAGHLGNWELPHYKVIEKNIPIALISRPPNSFLIKKLFDWIRFHPLVTIFFKGTRGSKQMMQHLKKGGNLGVLFDQRLSDGAPLSLFGHQALTATGPAKLAKKYGALMIPVQVERMGKRSHFKVTFHPPLSMHEDPNTIHQALNNHLESWIKSNPEQWLWLHKRWKR